MTQEQWDKEFDAELKVMFGIGINDTDPTYYRDLSPREAALAWGHDYDLERIDRTRIY